MSKLLKVGHVFFLSPRNLTLFLTPNRFSLRVLWINRQWIITTAISSHGWTWSKVHISVDFNILSQLSNSWATPKMFLFLYSSSGKGNVVKTQGWFRVLQYDYEWCWNGQVIQRSVWSGSLLSWYWSVKLVKHRGWLRDEEEIGKDGHWVRIKINIGI